MCNFGCSSRTFNYVKEQEIVSWKRNSYYDLISAPPVSPCVGIQELVQGWRQKSRELPYVTSAVSSLIEKKSGVPAAVVRGSERRSWKRWENHFDGCRLYYYCKCHIAKHHKNTWDFNWCLLEVQLTFSSACKPVSDIFVFIHSLLCPLKLVSCHNYGYIKVLFFVTQE